MEALILVGAGGPVAPLWCPGGPGSGAHQLGPGEGSAQPSGAETPAMQAWPTWEPEPRYRVGSLAGKRARVGGKVEENMRGS